MANTIRIKRRASGGAVGAPSSLWAGELAYNEQDNTLYIGIGTGGAGGTATSIPAIGGPGAFQPRDADLDAIAALTGTGLLKRTAANTWSFDTNTYLTSITSSDVTTALGYTPESTSNKGQANGYASLDSGGKVPSAQLPSFVDDVREYTNLAGFPATGDTGVIYIALDTNKTYRWSGSVYVEISPSPGSTDSVTEGTLNLYFTQARARAAISVSGSLSYNSTTGVISYTESVSSVAGRTGAVTLSTSDISGLGTMATQNANNVNITGGSLDGVTIDGGTY